MHINRNIFIILLLLNFSLIAQAYKTDIPWADGKSNPEDLQIYLVTFSPGDNLTDYFGHIALAVKDTVKNIGRVYNFGLFSFDEGFIKRFAFGRLIFWKGDASIGGTVTMYARMKRSITFHELNIPKQKKLILAKKLTDEVLPENSQYLYHHYKDNCATRLRDLIDDTIDGQFNTFTAKPARLTFRQHTLSHATVI